LLLCCCCCCDCCFTLLLFGDDVVVCVVVAILMMLLRSWITYLWILRSRSCAVRSWICTPFLYLPLHTYYTYGFLDFARCHIRSSRLVRRFDAVLPAGSRWLWLYTAHGLGSGTVLPSRFAAFIAAYWFRFCAAVLRASRCQFCHFVTAPLPATTHHTTFGVHKHSHTFHPMNAVPGLQLPNSQFYISWFMVDAYLPPVTLNWLGRYSTGLKF